MPEFRRITKDAWEQYPAKPAKKPDDWQEVMDALVAGEIIELPADDSNKLRGYRIGLGRRAKQHGIQLEYRSQGSNLAVQKVSDSPATDGTDGEALTVEAQPVRRGGRRKQTATGSTSADEVVTPEDLADGPGG